MSKTSVNQVIQRAVSDAAFRRQLQRDPASALKGFDLSTDERAAITSGDPTRLTSLGVDQRMSKAFVIGGLAGSASAVVTSDSGGAFSAALIDENVASGRGALIDENVASSTSSVIEVDPGVTSGVIAGDPASPNVAAFDPTTASGDLNTIDAGLPGGTTGAFESTDTTGDLNTIDPGLPGGTATAFEPASPSGDLNTIDAGLVSDDTDLGSAASAGEADGGLDTGGDVRPTEY